MEQDNTVTEETSQISPGIFEKMKKNREKNKKRALIIVLVVVGTFVCLLFYFLRHFIAEHALKLGVAVACVAGFYILYYMRSKKGPGGNTKVRPWKIAIAVVFVLIVGFGVYRLYTNQSSIQQATNQTRGSILDTLENLKKSKLDTAAKLRVMTEVYRRAIDSINAVAKLQQEYIRADQLVESNINAANAAIEEYEKLQASPNIITLSVSLKDSQKQAAVTGGGALVILKRE